MSLKIESKHSFYQRCSLGVTSLLLTQWAWVRSPVESVSWLKFFRGFPSTVRQMPGNLGHIRPQLSYGHHISSVYGRRRSDHSCSTWLSLNNKLQQQRQQSFNYLRVAAHRLVRARQDRFRRNNFRQNKIRHLSQLTPVSHGQDVRQSYNRCTYDLGVDMQTGRRKPSEVAPW